MTEATSSSTTPLEPVEHQYDTVPTEDDADGVVDAAAPAAAAGTGASSSSRRSEPKGPPSACLFVASLSGETTEDTLAAFFSQHGQVLKIKLLKDRSSRPYAFVQYQTPEEAERALHHTNGKALDNRRLRVERAKVNRTLFLAKLNRQLTNQQLREIVSEYGAIESVAIIKNHYTQKSKGCGFVKFVFREDAMDAFVGLKNKQRKWVIEWATSTNDPEQLGIDKNNVFVGGLNPALVTKELLEQRFIEYGDIESINLINRTSDSSAAGSDSSSVPEEMSLSSSSSGSMSPSPPPTDGTAEGSSGAGQPGTAPSPPVRGAFAFIRFKDPLASSAAIESANGTEWLERRIRVQYCESQEMKTKRRNIKYLSNFGQYNPQYYRGVQMAPPPVFFGVGGVPTAMYNLPMPSNGAPEVSAMRYPYTYPPMLYAPNAQSWGMAHYPPQAGPEQGGALSPHHVGIAQLPPVQPGGVGSLHIDPTHVHANGSHVVPHGVMPTAAGDVNGEQLAPGHHRVQPGGLGAPW